MTDLSDLGLDKARATAALTPAAREVHRWVLTVFAETGRAPRRAELERAARQQDANAGDTLSVLTGLDVLAFDERGEIRAAYPFSPVPTRHRVTWDGGPIAYAMCAIDALGMSAMLDIPIPIPITITEPGTERTVTVQVDHDTARWDPSTAVVFAGHTGNTCCPSADRTCGHINFFTTADAARAWAANNPSITGTVLDQHQALTTGIAEFGALLRTSDHPTTVDRRLT